MFEAILLAQARAVYDRLSAGDLADVDRIVRLLELNPWADDSTKFTANILS